MAWASTLPAAIDGLMAVFSAAPALSGVVVSDGASVAAASTAKLLAVGFSVGGDDLSATLSIGPEDFSGAREREDYDILCAASVVTGDADQSLSRTAVFAIYAAAYEAVRSDPTLGGAVMRARPGDFTLHQSASSRGRAATVQFTVSVTAFTA